MIHRSNRADGMFIALICGALIAIPGASAAQDSASYGGNTSAADNPGAKPAGSSPETVEVRAPRLLKFEVRRPNGTLQKASLEGSVRYDDLDLRTDEGVFALRDRIALEAADVCNHLAQLYPVYTATGSSCIKSATEDGNIRANRVIVHEREPSY